MLINKTRRSNKARFLLKYSEENSVFGEVSYYRLIRFQFQCHCHSSRWGGGGRLFWLGGGGGGGGRLFGAGGLITISAFRIGAFSRWALIRGWALIAINTVYERVEKSVISVLDCSQSPIFSWDRLDIPRLIVTGIFIFKCTERKGVGDYSSGGGGARKIASIFLASSQTAYAP